MRPVSVSYGVGSSIIKLTEHLRDIKVDLDITKENMFLYKIVGIVLYNGIDKLGPGKPPNFVLDKNHNLVIGNWLAQDIYASRH